MYASLNNCTFNNNIQFRFVVFYEQFLLYFISYLFFSYYYLNGNTFHTKQDSYVKIYEEYVYRILYFSKY